MGGYRWRATEQKIVMVYNEKREKGKKWRKQTRHIK